MWFRVLAISCFLSMATVDMALSREIPAGVNSARSDSIKADSLKIYRDIESLSDQNKFTRFMYRLFFKPVVRDLPQKPFKKRVIRKPYTYFEGKIIRNIEVETLDPFGNSIGDTITSSLNFLSKAGNRLHVKTFPRTIKNLLLVHKNQPFDSLRFKESERLVRSSGYVHDVSFFVKAASENSDSVDIFIRELDNWSIIPRIAASASRLSVHLSDENFSGLGHKFKNGFTWNHASDDYAYSTNYYIPNFRNTYINSTLHLGTDESGNFTRSFAIDRPFFSPFAKWAAGVSFTQFRKDSLYSDHPLPVLQPFKFNVQDYWAGNAVQIFKGNTEYKRATNFVSAIRYLRIRYLEKPIERYDMEHFFANEDFYLASMGISTRKYVQDKYIFNFGITEDVPLGKVYGVTGGYQVKNNSGRFYLGARISSGSYYPWGYLSSSFEYGTYFHASHTEQGVFSVSANYFTGLIEIGKWKFRQFVKPQVTIGINPSSNDSLTINDGYGLDGFNSPVLSGTSRLLFTLQTQSYAPWNFIGFRFGPYFIYSLGMLGHAATGFKNSKVYSQIGLGVLIKNENLVINTFQISIAFYPIIPGKGQNIFKINSFKTTDYGFRDFEIGKPSVNNYY